MKWISVIIASVLVGVVFADVDSGVENVLTSDAVSQAVANEGLNESEVEQAKRALKAKCVKNADLATYERVLAARLDMNECITNLVNVTVLNQEIELNKPTGNLDEVFKKYCRKVPTLQECSRNFTSTFTPCLEEGERAMVEVIHNVTSSLLKFICFKEGDRIALFIAEGGPECLSAHQEGIKECLNQTLGAHFAGPATSLHNAVLPTLTAKECSDIRTIQRCVVAKLETCSEPTPSNIIDSLINFAYKSTPCATLTRNG